MAWDILLKASLWRGPLIGKNLGHFSQGRPASEVMNVGLHAWDHYAGADAY